MKHSEFKKRRQALMKQIGVGNIAIVASASSAVRNRDVHYPFRQDSDFYYQTGFLEGIRINFNSLGHTGNPHDDVSLGQGFL